jgi:hypothetical protein
MLLGLYPIIELTRVIIVSGRYYFPDMDAQFFAEVAIMWLLYLAIIPVFLFISKHISIKVSRRKKENPGTTGIAETTVQGEKEYIRVNYNR